MVLRDDAAQKTDKFILIGERVIGYINETDFVVKLKHVLGVFVKIYKIAIRAFDFLIRLLEKNLRLALSFFTDDELYHNISPPVQV